jgi:L-lactate dehydrogenase complex protein LldG
MERDVFLARVRAATGARGPKPPPVYLSPSSAEDRAGAPARFAERWRRPHASCTQAALADAAAAVVRVLANAGVKRVVVSGDPLLAGIGLGGALDAAGIATVEPPRSLETVHAALPGVDAGVTVASYAVAETATLVEVSRPPQPRSLSLLPPLHVAVVRAEAVLASLDDLFAAVSALPVEHTLSLISGPSGTADIDLQHVVGVHGPRDVHVIIVDGALGSSHVRSE